MVPVCAERVVDGLPEEGSCRRTLRRRAEVDSFIADLSSAMAAAGYSEEDVYGLALALREAIANGFQHGSRGDPMKEVRVGYHVSPERAVAEVEDDGEGFDPDLAADPLAPENLDRPHGRGLFLMRALTTWLRFNDRGNQVTLCKERSGG